MATPEFVKRELTRQIEEFRILATLEPQRAQEEGPLLKQDLDMFERDDRRWSDASPFSSAVPGGSLAIQTTLGWDTLTRLQSRLSEARGLALIAGGKVRPGETVPEVSIPAVLGEVDVRDSINWASAHVEDFSEDAAEKAGALAGRVGAFAGGAAGGAAAGFLRGGGIAGAATLVLFGIGLFLAVRVAS